MSLRGGADLHLRDLLTHQVSHGEVVLAVGRIEEHTAPPPGVVLHRCRALARPVPGTRGLEALTPLLRRADVVHVHNVMNPTALAKVVATGKAVVTVQDHRVFCPGPGHTLPEGRPCDRLPGDEACSGCLPDAAYRARTLALTAARREALRGARLVVLSQYMADALAASGLADAHVIPPPVVAAEIPSPVGDHFLIGGRLDAHKGVVAAWQSWDRGGRPLPLRVAGSGPLADALPDTEALGWLDRGAWRQALRQARALLLTPRWQEPFGIAGLEALAEGTPVVGWCSGGMPDWSGAGVLRVPTGDTAQLAGLLERLARDEGEVAEAGLAGWRRVGERPGPEDLHRSLETVYGSVGAL